MEKTSVTEKRKFFTRLLVLFFALGNIFAKGPSASLIKTLTVHADSPTFFTAQENGYTLKIPDSDPYSVQTDLPQLPPGVVLVSSKREEYLDSDGVRGTSVHLWFTFKDTGPVKMPPLIVLVEGRTYYIPFEEVTVFEHPALINPQTQVTFESEVKRIRTADGRTLIKIKAGEEIVFSVGLKYFLQIISFDWKIPENSIFTEIERFDFSNVSASGRDFSTQVTPLARFSWKPLVEGEYQMPEVTVAATSYNGSRKTVQLPSVTVRVERGNSLTLQSLSKKAPKAEGVFDSAFLKTDAQSPAEKVQSVTKEECMELARLRSAERNSLPGGKERRERIEYEKKLGLSEGQNETKKSAAVSGFILTFLASALFVVFIISGHVRLSLIFFGISVLASIFSFRTAFKLKENRGIFSGGVLSPVPEKVSSSFLNADGPLLVKITEKTGEYFYIESQDVNGWVDAFCVFEIR